MKQTLGEQCICAHKDCVSMAKVKPESTSLYYLARKFPWMDVHIPKGSLLFWCADHIHKAQQIYCVYKKLECLELALNYSGKYGLHARRIARRKGTLLKRILQFRKAFSDMHGVQDKGHDYWYNKLSLKKTHAEEYLYYQFWRSTWDY